MLFVHGRAEQQLLRKSERRVKNIHFQYVCACMCRFAACQWAYRLNLKIDFVTCCLCLTLTEAFSPPGTFKSSRTLVYEGCGTGQSANLEQDEHDSNFTLKTRSKASTSKLEYPPISTKGVMTGPLLNLCVYIYNYIYIISS